MAEESTAPVNGATQEEGEAVVVHDAREVNTMSVEDYQQALARVRKEAARYRVERNELREDAEKWREKQESEKTELQRLKEQLAERDTRAQQLEAENTRLQVAGSYGISPENLDLLGSGSREEIEDRAKRLQLMQQRAVSAPPSRTPQEQLGDREATQESLADDAYPSNWLV